jgi:hypothetical protein
MAHAQYAYASGLGYASASYYESQAGIYYSGSSTYYGYSAYSQGTNWARADYYGGNTVINPQWAEAYGWSASGSQVGGAWAWGSIAAENWVTMTNTSSHYDLLTIAVGTSASSYASIGSWNDIGYAYGTGEFFDSAGLVVQLSETLAARQGKGYGSFGYAYNYDPYNGFTGVFATFPNVFPASLSAGASDFQYYYLNFAPGASDTFYTYGAATHSAYSITPGPAAVAPFALGLIGALRRRKKA